MFTVDTAPPSLTVTYDTERARYGEAVITVTGEPGARIRVTGAGATRSFTLQTGRHVLRAGLPPGTRPLMVTAQDAYGNTARRELRLVISDELTSGQLVRGLVGLLVFLGVLTVAAWLLWRHRRRLIVWNARRRERARLQAVERAARVAAERQAREEQLREIDDIGPVGAGKLLARKRPRLLPVYDSVIKRVFNRPHNDLTFWSHTRSALRADDRKLVNHLETVRDLAGIGDDITVLRVLDTAAWMHGKDA